MKTIVLAGGHISPAVAIAQEFRKRGYHVVVFGRGYAFEEAKDKPSLEKEMFEEMGVDFRPIEAPRPPRKPHLYVRYIYSVIRLHFKIKKNLQEINPIAVLSFGGYVAIPLLIAARSLKIPIFIHEQTTTVGKSNKRFYNVAQKVFISWPETVDLFPREVHNKLLLTGNPIRKEVLSLATKNWKNKKELTIYVTGGSTGAHAINIVVGNSLEKLLKKYRVIHQAGDSHFNDFEMLAEKRNSLPKDLQKKYTLVRYINLSAIGKIYEESDIVVGRSGANTVTEVALLGKPSIFIPLPLAQYNEQALLAKKLNDHGVAVILDQKDLSAETLLGTLENIARHYDTYVKHGKTYRESQEITRHKDAHRRIVDSVESGYN